MKGLAPLFLGIFATFAFSWIGLILIPNAQIGHLDPQTDEEGADPYPAPKSGLAERGREVYAANGCVYCHSQQVRADYAASDIERKWGDRRSAPRDYIFERPAMLGKMRMGPDLANIGKRAPVQEPDAAVAPTTPVPGAAPAPGAAAPAATDSAAAAAPGTSPAAPPAASPAPAADPGAPPTALSSAAVAAASPAEGAASPAPAGASPAPLTAAQPTTAIPAAEGPTTIAPDGEPIVYTAAWHHKHLYNPRSVSLDSMMPPYRFLYEKRRMGGERSADALQLEGDDAPPEGWEIVPSYEAKALVAYLMSLDQSHELKEVKTPTAAAAAPAAPAAPATPGNAVK